MVQINHIEYQKRVKDMPEASLMFIIKDCQEALAAMPDSEKAGYYQDEINYCTMELHRRRELTQKKAGAGVVEVPASLLRELVSLSEELNQMTNGIGEVSYDEWSAYICKLASHGIRLGSHAEKLAKYV